MEGNLVSTAFCLFCYLMIFDIFDAAKKALVAADFNNAKKADIIIYVDTTQQQTARCGFVSKFKKVIINLQESLNLEQAVTSKNVT